METIKVAIRSLLVNKLRSSLTILGIVVGIFSLISVGTILSVLEKSVSEGVSALGQNTFQIQKHAAIIVSDPAERARIRNRKDITMQEFYDLKEKLKSAKYVGGEIWRGGRLLKYESTETNPNVSLAGVTPDAFPNNKWNVAEGRAINNLDVHRYEKVIVLGADVAKVLFDYIDPIGQEVWVNGYKLKVIGVLESQGQFFGQSQDNFVIVPVTTFQNMYGKRANSVNITIMSKDKSSYDNLIAEAEGIFRTIRKVPLGKEDDFSIRTNEAILDQINNITAGVRIGAYVIAAIALVAAGVGIMNIMLVSVTERTREIGIRKAIGAKKLTILFQFVTEAVTLCLIGGIAGIILGVAAGNIAGALLNAVAVIPYDWISIGVLICCIIGVSFGTYPAYKAANLDPIEALRYE